MESLSRTRVINRCNVEIGRVVNFILDKNTPSNLEPLKEESRKFLSQHTDWLREYLKNEFHRLEIEDRSILAKYIIPGAEFVSGGLGVMFSFGAGVTTCAETFGMGCASAVVSGISSADHMAIGFHNIGKRASEQQPTFTVQGLVKLGLSEKAASYVQLGLDIASIGAAQVSASRIAYSKGTVRVYRVEGSPNQRLIIGEKGEVSLYPDKNQIIWLNFGDKQRANQYLQVKIAKGLPEAELKSFEINKIFVERIARDAVPETMARRFPNKPIISRDPYPNQYGIPAAYFDDLVQSIRQGSGKTVK